MYSITNDGLKKMYLKIIQDKTSFHNNEDYYLEADMRDYLKFYKMNPKRFN